MLFGVVNINEKAAINTNLDESSLNMISQYDTQYAIFRSNVSSQYNNSKNLPGYEPDTGGIADFSAEFFQTKDRIDQLKSTINLAFNLPDIFFLSIPFVDEEDLKIYKQITILLLIIVVVIAIIMAFFGRFWGDK